MSEEDPPFLEPKKQSPSDEKSKHNGDSQLFNTVSTNFFAEGEIFIDKNKNQWGQRNVYISPAQNGDF